MHRTSLLEMLPVMERIKDKEQYEVIVFVDTISAADVTDRGFILVGPGATHVTRHVHVASDLPQPSHHHKKMKERIFELLPKTIREYLWLRSRYKRSRALLIEHNVRAIGVTADRHVGWETAIVKAANDLQIGSLIIPFAVSVPGGPAAQRMRDPAFRKLYDVKRPINALIAFLFPQWAYTEQGKRILFYPPFRILAAMLTGQAPQTPWALGGGAAARMAVESEHESLSMQHQGVPKEKILVTGRPSMDALAESCTPEFQEMVLSELNISKGKSMIVLAVPQLAEHHLLSWPDHWKEMDFLFSTLTRLPNSQLVLSLHPKSDPVAYAPYATKHGAIISKRRIFEILPAARFLVSELSSTVRLAAGIKKPAVIMGHYGFDPTGFDDLPGTIFTKTRDELFPACEKMFDDGFYGSLIDDVSRTGTDETILDGKCTDRIVAELERLAR
jgi:hypothetical protein